ncbi:MAG TPA: ATP-dependent DNA ligase [Pseudonocardiaceae bacterium]|jgi:ATP-dependent DNA ligase
MDLPLSPPLLPMLAKSVRGIPEGNFLYEPKWDGFRCIVFRDGAEVELASRNERPLTRYFPEVVEAVLANLPARCVVDGELVLARDNRLDFEALQLRLHPAASRVRLLAEQTPASFVAFDLLALGHEALLQTPFEQRRRRLEDALRRAEPPIHLTPVTTDLATAREWFDAFEGAGLDGLVAKARDLPYVPDQRLMLKVKHERTADCVVAGFRWHKSGPIVGSLLLGLYDGDRLQHVGVAGSFSMARRAALVEELAPLRVDALDGHPWAEWAVHQEDWDRRPGMQSRWNPTKSMSWEPLRPTRVAEVRYGGLEGRRFRHTAQFVRWRDDRDPGSCTYDQLDEPVSYDLAAVLR